MPVISAVSEHLEFQASLSYTARPYLKKLKPEQNRNAKGLWKYRAGKGNKGGQTY
jgi:hypothetical protein